MTHCVLVCVAKTTPLGMSSLSDDDAAEVVRLLSQPRITPATVLSVMAITVAQLEKLSGGVGCEQPSDSSTYLSRAQAEQLGYEYVTPERSKALWDKALRAANE
jgi:hypothetical protein